tara:strand:+ start:951 stop:1163 length:213 start_codon:yes stop_codon:yes gene_type:complete
MREIIAKLGMGYHEGPFELSTNGNQPNWKGLDWPGPAGETVIASAIEIHAYNTYVIIDGKRYNSTCFVKR